MRQALSWKNILKVLKWLILTLLALFILLTIARIPGFIEKKKTEEVVAKIHATKLTMGDVMGDNLPPDPGPDADKTIAGIDANQNGIRDDVELAIFKKYPDSAKTRAALLQYALTLQMEVAQPLVNKEVVIAVAQEEGRAYQCIGENSAGSNVKERFNVLNKELEFIENLELNTQERKDARKIFFEKIGSFKSVEDGCDVRFDEALN